MSSINANPSGEPFLYQEILEQPAVLSRLIGEERRGIAEIAQVLNREQFRYIVIAARGSSDNAALYGKYLFATINRLPVALATPSLFTLYGQPPSLHQSLVIGISQSGESTDIVEVLREAQRQGVPTLAITNEPSAPILSVADYQILLHAGQERSIAATKTYTAQLVSLALLAVALAKDDSKMAAVERLPEAISATLQLDTQVRQMAERYRFMESCVVLGRGYNYATAIEIALKLKELAYVLAEPYSPPDFLHGPIALVERGFSVIAAMPEGKTLDHVMELVQTLRNRDVELVVISDKERALGMATRGLRLPVTVDEWLSPVTAVVPGQLFAYYLTMAKGYDPDHPRGLRKVTVTR